jgi:hypothetical protein
MSAEPDLFATAMPDASWGVEPARRDRGATRRMDIAKDVEPVVVRAPPFDPYRHPCAVCGAANAPFGEGYPRAPQFYCRGHREEERRDILAGDADRGS